MSYTEKVNNFFKKSLQLIDNQDIDREFSNTQIKYGTELLKKDMNIKDLNYQINCINDKTGQYNNSNKTIKGKLNLIQESLN